MASEYHIRVQNLWINKEKYVHNYVSTCLYKPAAKERKIGEHSKNVMSTAGTLHITMKFLKTLTEKTLPH